MENRRMPEPVRWGILGAANIALTKVIPAIQSTAHSRVVAIASRDLAKARSAAASLDIPRAYGSYDELIADAEVDAIYNPLPNHLHVPLVRPRRRRGEARALREADRDVRRRSAGVALRARSERRRDRRGVHGARPPAVAGGEAAGRLGRYRRATSCQRPLQLLSPRPRTTCGAGWSTAAAR